MEGKGESPFPFDDPLLSAFIRVDPRQEPLPPTSNPPRQSEARASVSGAKRRVATAPRSGRGMMLTRQR